MKIKKDFDLRGEPPAASSGTNPQDNPGIMVNPISESEGMKATGKTSPEYSNQAPPKGKKGTGYTG